jgi:hypothetical protein
MYTSALAMASLYIYIYIGAESGAVANVEHPLLVQGLHLQLPVIFGAVIGSDWSRDGLTPVITATIQFFPL